jgi:hypothetical protein
VANFLAIASAYDVSVLVSTLSNMSSKKDWIAALDAVDYAHRAVSVLPFQTLQPADQRALLVRLDALEKLLAVRQRQLLGQMVAGPPPREFAGAPWAEVLARRLRISIGEAQRRIADAGAGAPL